MGGGGGTQSQSEGTYLIVMSVSPPVVDSLLKKSLQKEGVTGTLGPPPPFTPLLAAPLGLCSGPGRLKLNTAVFRSSFIAQLYITSSFINFKFSLAVAAPSLFSGQLTSLQHRVQNWTWFDLFYLFTYFLAVQAFTRSFQRLYRNSVAYLRRKRRV